MRKNFVNETKSRRNPKISAAEKEAVVADGSVSDEALMFLNKPSLVSARGYRV